MGFHRIEGQETAADRVLEVPDPSVAKHSQPSGVRARLVHLPILSIPNLALGMVTWTGTSRLSFALGDGTWSGSQARVAIPDPQPDATALPGQVVLRADGHRCGSADAHGTCRGKPGRGSGTLNCAQLRSARFRADADGERTGSRFCSKATHSRNSVTDGEAHGNHSERKESRPNTGQQCHGKRSAWTEPVGLVG